MWVKNCLCCHLSKNTILMAVACPGVCLVQCFMMLSRKTCDQPGFYLMLKENPKVVLKCMSAAIQQVRRTEWMHNLEDVTKILVRLHNYSESMLALMNLKASYIDKLVSVRVIVVKVSPPSFVSWMGVKAKHSIPFELVLKQPTLIKYGCKNSLNLMTMKKSGCLELVINHYMDIGGGNYLYLAAVSIKNSKSQSIHLRSCNILTLMQEKSSCLIFSHSPKRLQFIMKFFSGECGSDVFCQILQSLCSSIYGHELVKGCPGLGKNQLRQATAAVSTHVTARQLKSLVRLAEARARVDLREKITVQDTMDVVEIIKESLYDKYADEHGVLAFGRSGGNESTERSQVIYECTHKQSELQHKDSFSYRIRL
ncbi:putative DNA helicase MCM8, partial [Cucurbita argyrosperma subsp. sororia]